MRVALEDVAVAFLEDLLGDEFPDERRDLLARRPDVAQIDGGAFLVMTERFGRQIFRHRAGDRVRDYERRRREIVRLHVGADAALKIAVAGKNSRSDNAI